MSNAMSHSALAAGEGDMERGEWMRGGEGREYFCMLYEARRHMPSEPRCLLSQGSWFDRPLLAPYVPPERPPLPLTNTLLPLGLPKLQQRALQSRWVCMVSAQSICVSV